MTQRSGRLEPPSFESLDAVQREVLVTTLNCGQPVQTRGLASREIQGVSFSLLNPRRRCITTPARRWSLPLAIGEFCWHVSGSNDLSSIAYYASRWREFSDDARTIRGSCYGHRIFAPDAQGCSQWDRLLRLLRSDLTSRRAILSLHDSAVGLDAASRDVPCACVVQFLVRSNRLNTVVYMRSNDAIWGLPYDVFLFTMLQELLTAELGLTVGSYTHSVGSLHIYDRHIELAERVIEDQGFDFEMPQMEGIQGLSTFLALADEVRQGLNPDDDLRRVLHPYWADLLEVLRLYRLTKLRNGPAEFPSEFIYAPLLRTARFSMAQSHAS